MREIVVILYFFLLFYVAVYGIHIYWLIFLYLKSCRAAVEFPSRLSVTPRVTIQLPVFCERTVIRRLISATAAIEWPRDKLEIQVLDDSTDDTCSIAAVEVARLRSGGINIVHIMRGSRSGYKAGALQHGLQSAQGEFIAVFDADNIPRPDFLRKTMPYFSDANIGMVQARWSFINREESLLCRAQALFLDAHFYVEQMARSYGRLFMNFNGTAGVWRRQAIDDAGGWRADTLTEDLDLSYRSQMAGWRMILAPEIDVPTELPGSIRAFKTQQFRWSKGAFETGLKLLPGLLTQDIPFRIKLASLFHLTQKTVALALLLLSALLIPALYYRLEGGVWKVLMIDLPIFIAGTGSMSLFYGLAHAREKKTRSWKDSLILPLLTSIGIGLAVNNSLAIISALLGKHKTFVRTPKSGSDGLESHTVPADYRVQYDLSMPLEIGLAIYSTAALVCAAGLELYPSIPFLVTFVFGYLYFATGSLREQYAK